MANAAILKLHRIAIVFFVVQVLGCSSKDITQLDRTLIEATKTGDLQHVETSIKSGADVDARNESHRTVLMLAALKGNLPVVTALLNHGADVNATDTQGMTPLMWAAFGGVPKVVKTLLEHGAKPEVKDNNGETAAQWARSNNQAVVDLLKNVGKQSTGRDGAR